MKIDIREITTEQEWNKGLENFKYTTLFLSWEWVEFEKESKRKVETYGVYENEKLVGLLPIKFIYAKRGNYLHARHAPLIDWNDSEVTNTVTNFLKTKAKQNKMHFVRISPLISSTVENQQILHKLGYRESFIHSTDAELTVTIDLTQTEEEILKNMKKTTRNMIRKAEKLDLKVKHSNDLEMFQDFAAAYKDTIVRNKWTAYPLSYIKREFYTFQKNGNADLFVTYYNERPISATIYIRHRNQIIYHFSGSLTEFRDIPASYLMHWEAIKFYKSQGYEIYNFWGVSPEGMKSHPWYGFSLFKRGFSNNELEFIHSQDLDIHPFAKLTHLFEFLESRLRGYR